MAQGAFLWAACCRQNAGEGEVRLALGLSLASWACVSTSPSPQKVSLESWEHLGPWEHLESWEKKWEQKSAKKQTAQRGNLFIRCEPEDAEVLLDGIPQGSCADYVTRGLQLNASAGLRKIVVAKLGYWPYEALVAIDRSKVNLRVQLQPLQAPASP